IRNTAITPPIPSGPRAGRDFLQLLRSACRRENNRQSTQSARAETLKIPESETNFIYIYTFSLHFAIKSTLISYFCRHFIIQKVFLFITVR
ncbi:MAG: hypothetical protein K2F88_07570, partial [Duncaniella sp.]|nr:hypothetical protein [Duncaniella sp.]